MFFLWKPSERYPSENKENKMGGPHNPKGSNDSLMKREEDIKTVHDALGFILADPVLTNLFPNVIKLVKLAAICPFGNASVERVFSLLKLVKNRLRSKVTQKTLDLLIRIKLESPDKLSEAQLTDLSENFRDLLIEKSSTGQTRLLY